MDEIREEICSEVHIIRDGYYENLESWATCKLSGDDCIYMDFLGATEREIRKEVENCVAKGGRVDSVDKGNSEGK